MRQTRKKKGGKLLKIQPTNENYNFFLPDNNTTRQDSHDASIMDSRDNTFNNKLFVRESHNCYTYFLNLKSKNAVELCKRDFKNNNMCRRAQPGYLFGYDNMSKTDYKCPIIEERTLKDNPIIYKLKNSTDKCDPRFYKGAMVVAPGRDYHYYRLNDDGVWTHKPGYKPSTRFDSDNNIIIDPKLAARDYGGNLNYKDFCGYYCIPRNSNRKNMAHRDYSFENRKLVKKNYKAQNKLLKNLKIGKTRKNFNSLAKHTASLIANKTIKNKRNLKI